MSKNIYELLEECLSQMQAGAPIDEVLRTHDQQAADLRPLLEASLAARSLQAGPAPTSAQNRSRAQFLAAAAELRQPARRGLRLGFLPLRALVPALMVLLVVVSSLFVTGLVSAQSLPGDGLYPVKIAMEQAQLRLTTGTASRLSLEETFDERRVMEVADLLKRGELRQVSFAGFLSRPKVNEWRVAGIPVTFSPQAKTPIVPLVGTYVEVNGLTTSGQVNVSQVQLRLFHVTGTIEAMNPQLWQVAGVPVKIAPETHILGTPALGRQVQISAIRVATDRLLALAVRFVDAPSSNQNQVPVIASTATALSGASGAATTASPTATAVPPTATAVPTVSPTAEPLRIVVPTSSGPSDSGESGGGSPDGGGGDHHDGGSHEDGGSHD